MGLKDCECGHEAWCVVDCGTWHVECSKCGRHTGPYIDVDDAVMAWNYGQDVSDGTSAAAPSDYNNGYHHVLEQHVSHQTGKVNKREGDFW